MTIKKGLRSSKKLNKMAIKNILTAMCSIFMGRSCETQLIQLVEDLARNMTSGKQTDLILLDFSKAFDKVNHLKLLYKQ